jgi:hypothetical protein
MTAQPVLLDERMPDRASSSHVRLSQTQVIPDLSRRRAFEWSDWRNAGRVCLDVASASLIRSRAVAHDGKSTALSDSARPHDFPVGCVQGTMGSDTGRNAAGQTRKSGPADASSNRQLAPILDVSVKRRSGRNWEHRLTKSAPGLSRRECDSHLVQGDSVQWRRQPCVCPGDRSFPGFGRAAGPDSVESTPITADAVETEAIESEAIQGQAVQGQAVGTEPVFKSCGIAHRWRKKICK